MRVMSAKDAKNHFGEVLMEAQRDGVTIEKNGRPVAVVLSYAEHEANERLKLERLRLMIAKAEEASAQGRVYELTDDLVQELCHAEHSQFDK